LLAEGFPVGSLMTLDHLISKISLIRVFFTN
jgi:hypothetical protein